MDRHQQMRRQSLAAKFVESLRARAAEAHDASLEAKCGSGTGLQFFERAAARRRAPDKFGGNASFKRSTNGFSGNCARGFHVVSAPVIRPRVGTAENRALPRIPIPAGNSGEIVVPRKLNGGLERCVGFHENIPGRFGAGRARDCVSNWNVRSPARETGMCSARSALIFQRE